MKKSREMFLYLLFGGLTTLVNIVTFYFLDKTSLSTAISTTIAWFVSVIFAFFTNKIFVFESRNKSFLKELISFFGCRVMTGVFDLLVMVVFVDVLKCNSMLIKVVSNILVIIFNYLLSKFFIFKKE